MGKLAGRVLTGIGTLGLSEVARAAAPEQPKLKMPTPQLPPMRELPAEEKDLTSEEIGSRARAAKGAVGLMSPSYLGLDPNMSDLQRRGAIATKATSGDLGSDPNAFKYYRDLAFRTLSEPGATPLPVERQYLSVFGEPTRDTSTGGFLSAIERIYKRS